jgi:transcriptional regulator GlxA family with amidase domain
MMAEEETQRTLGVVLYPGFELLDTYGPLEAFGHLPEAFRIVQVAEQVGPVASAQGPRVMPDATLAEAPKLDWLLVPGGIGTRAEVDNAKLVDWLRARAATAERVASVCTGAALLARAGLLDGRRATSNKAVFSWVTSQGPRVTWVPEARWVHDGKFSTSSGVSAGIDMTLDLIAKHVNADTSEALARAMEYEWHRDPAWDPFAKVWGLA